MTGKYSEQLCCELYSPSGNRRYRARQTMETADSTEKTENASMQYALNSQQMKEADSRMIQQMGIPSLVLMERAALETVAAMKEEGTDLSRALIVCGSGNNGGDRFAIARLLAEEGCRPETVFVGMMESRSPETRQQMEILEHMGIPAGNTWEKEEYSVIIDAVLESAVAAGGRTL